MEKRRDFLERKNYLSNDSKYIDVKKYQKKIDGRYFFFDSSVF